MIALPLFVLLCSPALAGHLRPERDYQAVWCGEAQGQAEVVLQDGSRVDCLTSTHAVELDFAPKWAEAIGQSLHYAALTCQRAGIVLILERPVDRTHLERLRATIRAYGLPIDVWVVGPEASQE